MFTYISYSQILKCLLCEKCVTPPLFLYKYYQLNFNSQVYDIRVINLIYDTASFVLLLNFNRSHHIICIWK